VSQSVGEPEWIILTLDYTRALFACCGWYSPPPEEWRDNGYAGGREFLLANKIIEERWSLVGPPYMLHEEVRIDWQTTLPVEYPKGTRPENPSMVRPLYCTLEQYQAWDGVKPAPWYEKFKSTSAYEVVKLLDVE